MRDIFPKQNKTQARRAQYIQPWLNFRIFAAAHDNKNILFNSSPRGALTHLRGYRNYLQTHVYHKCPSSSRSRRGRFITSSSAHFGLFTCRPWHLLYRVHALLYICEISISKHARCRGSSPISSFRFSRPLLLRDAREITIEREIKKVLYILWIGKLRGSCVRWGGRVVLVRIEVDYSGVFEDFSFMV